MSITERFSKALDKRMFRAGYILALGLVWQASLSPLVGQFGSNLQYFSQVAINAGSTTSFTINNPSATETITVEAQLYLPDGTPLADGQVELGPEATETLSFGDPQETLTSGWAELKSDDAFIATEFFQLFITGELKPRVGVLPSVASKEIRFLGFVNPQFKSGLALTNPSSTEASEITLRAKDQAGQEPVPEKTLTLAPLHSEAGYLNEEKFLGAALSNYEGVVEISVNSPAVAAVSLIQEVHTGDVATVSVLTQSHIITAETNTALGIGALVSNTTGSENIAIGYLAGENNSTGNNNIHIGHSGFNESNTIRIGGASHDNAFIAGVQLVPVSSRQFKQDIHDMDKASSDLMRLRPVTFRYKKAYDSGEGRLQYGLIAEEAAEVYPELVVYDDTGKVKTVEYQKLPAMLLNELQKQHQVVQQQQEQMQQQQVVTDNLRERLSRLEQVLSLQSAASTHRLGSP